MSTLALDGEKIFKVAGDPATYTAAPFLAPIKPTALKYAAKYRDGCKTCHRPQYLKIVRAIASAFTKLTVDADAAQREELKRIAIKILNVKGVKQILIQYKDPKGQSKELVF